MSNEELKRRQQIAEKTAIGLAEEGGDDEDAKRFLLWAQLIALYEIARRLPPPLDE